jgi:acyl carrier protein
MNRPLLASPAPVSIAAHHNKAKTGLALLTDDYDQIDSTVRAVLRDVLGLSEARVAAFHAETPLFGALPELDSMAVAGLLTEIEERLGILIEDDEVDGEMLESFGSLVRFAAAKAPR